ncbi:hypothetical protein APHAL10511_005529 [Amanita phalloides]|nr:hypothetical protein APHAL10511_005529 [Amanita phalloides]
MIYISAARTILVAAALAAFSNVCAKQPRRRRSAGDFSFAPQSNSSDFALGLSFEWTSTTNASTSQLIGLKRRDPPTKSRVSLQLKKNEMGNLWVAPVQIGTPRIRDPDPRTPHAPAHTTHTQTLDILFSTVSDISWVGSCPQFKNTYTPLDSSSARFIEKSFYLDEMDKNPTENLRAHTYSDVVNVAELETRLEFGVVSNARRLDPKAQDGIFSLSRFTDLPSEHPRQNFFESEFLEPKTKPSNIFAFNMPGNYAEIRFGRSNVQGIEYHFARKRSRFWEIGVPGSVIVGESIWSTHIINARIDSGTYLIYGPHDEITSVYKHVGIEPNLDPKGYYTFSCGHKFTADVHFTWKRNSFLTVSRNDFIYSRKDQICTGIFKGNPVAIQSKQWILGQSFIKGKLVELDGVQNRIGFREAIPLHVPKQTSMQGEDSE